MLNNEDYGKTYIFLNEDDIEERYQRIENTKYKKNILLSDWKPNEDGLLELEIHHNLASEDLMVIIRTEDKDIFPEYAINDDNIIIIFSEKEIQGVVKIFAC